MQKLKNMIAKTEAVTYLPASRPCLIVNKTDKMFKDAFYDSYPFLKRFEYDPSEDDEYRFVIAGGSVCNHIIGRVDQRQQQQAHRHERSDIDFFIINPGDIYLGKDDYAAWIIQTANLLGSKYNLQIIQDNCTITINAHNYADRVHHKIQLILEEYGTAEDLFDSFDLPSCQVLFDGKKVVFGKRALQAYATGYNVLDLKRYEAGLYELRAIKYWHRGFGLQLQQGLSKEDLERMPMLEISFAQLAVHGRVPRTFFCNNIKLKHSSSGEDGDSHYGPKRVGNRIVHEIVNKLARNGSSDLYGCNLISIFFRNPIDSKFVVFVSDINDDGSTLNKATVSKLQRFLDCTAAETVSVPNLFTDRVEQCYRFVSNMNYLEREDLFDKKNLNESEKMGWYGRIQKEESESESEEDSSCSESDTDTTSKGKKSDHQSSHLKQILQTLTDESRDDLISLLSKINKNLVASILIKRRSWYNLNTSSIDSEFVKAITALFAGNSLCECKVLNEGRLGISFLYED